MIISLKLVVILVLADVLWGTFLGASVSTAAYFIGSWLKG